jgi:predicted metal-binding protein
MLNNLEVKTVCIPFEEYCKDYRDEKQFIEFCKECPRYGHLWCCPPFDFDTTAKMTPYRYVYIIGIRTTVDPQLREMVKDPVTIGEMAEFLTKDFRRVMDDIVLGLEKAVPGSLAFYAGPCYLCKYCARLSGKSCRYPDKMRSSLESYGFDVAKTTENLLGYQLEWNNDKLPEHLSFISALFTKEKIDL